MLPEKLQELVEEQLQWFETKLPKRPSGHEERLLFSPGDIQGGILSNYGGPDHPITHGGLMLMRVVDPDKARQFIGKLPVDSEEAGAAQRIYLNLALTRNGLAVLGVPPAEIDKFPQEFREGMEDRAGLLGDLRDSHPRRWNLPERNWPPQPAAKTAQTPLEAAKTPVEISEIDIVIQLRVSAPDYGGHDILDAGHPLHERVKELAASEADTGVRLLAVESMRRASMGQGAAGLDHFGYLDGISQPVVRSKPPSGSRDEVSRGEILLGYANDRADPPPPRNELLDNGTFLVVRKLSQDVPLWRKFLTDACPRNGPLTEYELRAKLMGRTPDGVPLAKPVTAPKFNDFDYSDDRNGDLCPFQSHIRRTHPRTSAHGRPTPRILRRGLSYGPPFNPDEEKSTKKDRKPIQRGIFFMVYNASIAEQFEVVQRWVNGGNSTSVASCQNDPLMGVGAAGDQRTFCFRHEGMPVRVNVPESLVRLQWGTYLFVPSMAAIRKIASGLRSEQDLRKDAEVELVEKGKRIIARLDALADQGAEGKSAAAAGWKACLEDFGSKDPAERGDGPAVWAAIRAAGGVRRVLYGQAPPGETPRQVVLVASKKLVMNVFRNREKYYSMRGQMERMNKSFGPIFLGLDEGEDYDRDSRINRPIMSIKEKDAFNCAYGLASAWLEGVLRTFCAVYGERAGEFDLRRDFITPILAAICNQWFGIPDALGPGRPALDKCDPNHVDAGGWSWDCHHKPRCPGDFMATSRYCFYPDPVERVQSYGQAQGQALREAVREHFDEVRPRGVQAPLARIMAKFYPNNDLLARTLIGVMTGFLPPADASVRWTLYDWLEERILWDIQRDLVSAPGDPYTRAKSALAPPLKRAMQKRPSPDMLWRTALQNHSLGGEPIKVDDRIFIGIVSAMAEDVANGVTEVYPVFGGDRRQVDQSGKPDHPLHACPAYNFAMGVMLGMLAALLDKVRVETLPAPLLVKISDWGPCPAPQPAAPGGPSPGPQSPLGPASGPAPPPPGVPPQAPAPPGTETSPQSHEGSSAPAPPA
jgi:Dyp-type peroxidase family